MLSLKTLGVLALTFNPLSPIFKRDAPGKGFSCPASMEYSPWIQTCACPPGQSYSADSKSCRGEGITGPWAEPPREGFGADAEDLQAFCAADPTHVVVYDPGHEYCRAGVGTVTFVASRHIGEEVSAKRRNGLSVDDASPELKNVLAALSGMYLPDASDAAALFSTEKFGLSTLLSDVRGTMPGGVFSVVDNLLCKVMGGSKCMYDCVSYCAKGCANHLGQEGPVGGLLGGLNGFCVLDGSVEVVGDLGETVEKSVDERLCVVGKILGELPSLFGCDCDGKDEIGNGFESLAPT